MMLGVDSWRTDQRLEDRVIRVHHTGGGALEVKCGTCLYDVAHSNVQLDWCGNDGLAVG